MKRFISISLIILIALMFIYSMFGTINAGYMSSTLTDGTVFSGNDETKAADSVKTVFGTATAVVKVVAVAVAVIMLLAIAVKYMTAAPGEKANVTKSALQFLIGAIVIFAAVGILTIIENFSGVIKKS